MLFNSLEYLLFFLTILLLTWSTVGFPKLRIWILLLASYYFYISNNQWLVVLIAFSTQVDFWAGKCIAATDDPIIKKRWLVLSLAANLGVLGFFKYFNFFASSLYDLVYAIGFKLDWVDLHIILPVGISFYTFQSMSYTIDVYRGKIEAEQSWARFAFFVSFFPQLIAGPIIRASTFLPQTYRRPVLTAHDVEFALFRIFRGLFKKIVLADMLAMYVDQTFGNPSSVDSFTAWLGVYAFAFQIYFDFSAYTDIAIGSACLLGYKFPENFNRPYVAQSLTDFWRRWHISLSSWLRDYLYIPMGGNRTRTQLGMYRNIMATMLLGGLWHGAAWSFVLWGGIHGLYLVLEKSLASVAKPFSQYGHEFIRMFLIFHLVLVTWILFRIEDMQSLIQLLDKLFSFDPPTHITHGMYYSVLIISAGWLSQYIVEKGYLRNMDWYYRVPIFAKGLLYASVFLCLVVMNSQSAQPFIYFQF